MLIFFIVFIIIAIVVLVFEYFNNKKSKNNKAEFQDNTKITDTCYQSKQLITKSEKYFLDIIDNNFGDNYRIIPQVPLSSIINKHKEFENQYQNELYRTIDIGIFDKNTFKPLLMIEINDKTHKQYKRYKRDLKVKEILQSANIPLLTFYTDMPNKPDYIIDRIRKNLL